MSDRGVIEVNLPDALVNISHHRCGSMGTHLRQEVWGPKRGKPGARMSLGTLLPTLVAVLVGLAPFGPGASAWGQVVDWSAWEELPVFHNGRVMPLVSFAEETVELICGRANPVLELDSSTARAPHLFPEGNRRRFRASELLFSWIVEPELWEDIPFLQAAREELRELLGLPLRDAGGRRLLYASPRVVAQSVRLREQLRRISEKLHAEQGRSGRAALSPLEESCQRLYQAYQLFRMVSFRPDREGPVPESFWERLVDVGTAFRDCREHWRQLGTVPLGEAHSSYAKVGERLIRIQEFIHKLIERHEGDAATNLSHVEPALMELRQAAEELRSEAVRLRELVFRNAPPDGMRPERWQDVRAAANRLAVAARGLRRHLRTCHLELYEATFALRVVPAIDLAALDMDREGEDDPRVWLALSTVLAGPVDLWPGVASERIAAVGERFRQLAGIYRTGLGRSEAGVFAAQLREFAESLRKLGEDVNAARQQQLGAQHDEEFWRLTRYPPPGALQAELAYHRYRPFFWACVSSAIAAVAFALSFGVVRGLFFGVGVVTLAGAAIFVGWGLSLRALVTGYMPVTNMFETVVFVAMVTAILGLWIVNWPWFGPALLRAWRASAIPRTFEATPLAEADLAFASASVWNRWGWVSSVCRIVVGVLTIIVLTNIRSGAKGGEPVFSLLPRTSPGGVMLLNDWVVWLVGLAVVLLAAWFVPRVIVTLVLTPAFLPASLRQMPATAWWQELLNRRAIGLMSAAVTLLAALVAYLAPISGKRIAPLMPVLRDNFWLALHVLTITASYGAGALVWGLANLSLAHFLFGRYRVVPEDPEEEVAPTSTGRVYKIPPQACTYLARFMYRGMQVAVLLLAAGIIFGGLWADVSWGRFWGWDSKEVWALIALLVYLGVLHGRLIGMLNEFGLAVGAVAGATAIIVAWYGVNFVFGSGLHAYGGGTGGGAYVAAALVLNWLFVGAAWLRYKAELLANPKAALQTEAVASAQAASSASG